MAKQIGAGLIALGILLAAAGAFIGKPSVTGNVALESAMKFNDYAVASALGMSIILLMAGFVFYFRVRPGQ
jgi:hypothetical protein